MIDFSEKDLEREVAELCMAEQNILDRRLAQIPSRKLSPEFDRKMNRLLFLRKIRYDIFFNTVGKRVAAIIICVVIAGTTTVMSVEALRDGLFELIEKVYTRFSEITFEPVQSTYSMPEVFEEYSITNIPEGFTLETEHINESLFNKIRGNNIGMIFQDPLASLNPLMKVGDQVAETLYYHTDMDEKARHARVIELFNQVGMPRPEEMYQMYPHELSGGLRQRVVIAIAIACKPEIIIADEPTTALDVTIQAQILDLLKEIQKESHSGIVLITHDLGVVAETADQVAVMYAGQIVEKADVKTIFENPLHPYTRSLLHSMPQTDDESEDLHVIHGTVPSLINMPRTGDRFAARIPWIPASAHEENPKVHEVEPGHFVRCTCWQSFHFQDEEKKG